MPRNNREHGQSSKFHTGFLLLRKSDETSLCPVLSCSLHSSYLLSSLKTPPLGNSQHFVSLRCHQNLQECWAASPTRNTEEGTQQDLTSSVPRQWEVTGNRRPGPQAASYAPCMHLGLSCPVHRRMESNWKCLNDVSFGLWQQSSGLKKKTKLSATCKAPEFPMIWQVKPILPAVSINCLFRHLSADWAPGSSVLKLLFHAGSRGWPSWGLHPIASAEQWQRNRNTWPSIAAADLSPRWEWETKAALGESVQGVPWRWAGTHPGRKGFPFSLYL